MTYVDGFVCAVANQQRDAYLAHAECVAQIFKEYGALRVVECWEDDVPPGTTTSFPLAVRRRPHESVVFSWVMWPSREIRDTCMAKVISDPRLDPAINPMPFDGKRLIYGGFNVIFDA